MYMTKFQGIYTALITPFKQGKIDEQTFGDFVNWQVEQGVHGLVPCGTTGESPTLTYEEHNRVITLAVEAAAGRAVVMAGTGANATDEAVMFTKHAQAAGADCALVVAPYYNKPTPEGIYQHFKAIHDATDIPIIVYNIPGRSVIDISDEALVRLGQLPRIIGVKDATGDLSRPYSLRAAGGGDLTLFSGEDMTSVPFNIAGGSGCISVASNVVPKLTAQIQQACLDGNYTHAAELHEQLITLNQVLFSETSPGPVKYALSLMGKCSSELRLPLVEPTEDTKKNIHKAIKELNLI